MVTDFLASICQIKLDHEEFQVLDAKDRTYPHPPDQHSAPRKRPMTKHKALVRLQRSNKNKELAETGRKKKEKAVPRKTNNPAVLLVVVGVACCGVGALITKIILQRR